MITIIKIDQYAMNKFTFIFISAFLIGAVFVSTATAMVFTKPGISELVLMRIVSVLNPNKYSASIWETVEFTIK